MVGQYLLWKRELLQNLGYMGVPPMLWGLLPCHQLQPLPLPLMFWGMSHLG